MQRHTSLHGALVEIEAGTLTRISRVVVSRGWWDALSTAEQESYRRRCLQQHVELSADDRISRHFVELTSDEREPPLSSEQRV